MELDLTKGAADTVELDILVSWTVQLERTVTVRIPRVDFLQNQPVHGSDYESEIDTVLSDADNAPYPIRNGWDYEGVNDCSYTISSAARTGSQ